jgi:hypothetical protein
MGEIGGTTSVARVSVTGGAYQQEMAAPVCEEKGTPGYPEKYEVNA